MKAIKSGLEWQDQLSDAEPAVQIFEDRKENLTEQDILRQDDICLQLFHLTKFVQFQPRRSVCLLCL